MRLPAIALAILAATLLIAPAGSQDQVNQPRAEQTQAPAGKIAELRKERLAVLQAVTDQLTQLYQHGRVEFDELLEARLQLFQAQLDAAEKQSDRVAICKNLVDELTKYEDIAQARLEAAQGTAASVLKVKARRLEAEIRLEQAKADDPRGKQGKTTVGNPQVANVTVTQRYLGRISAQRHIEIRALETGYIESIFVKAGETVKQGDLVFKMAPGLYKAKLDAELADVKLAEQELQNAQRLFENKVVGPNDVALLETKLEKAQAQAEAAKAELSFTEVRAPFDGIIDRLQGQPGSMIKEGEAMTTLSDCSAVWVYFQVPEASYLQYLASADKEQAAELELVLADGSKFGQRGAIQAIDAQFDPETGTIPFRADFPNPDALLRHGMTGNVLVQRTLTNALVIPQRATFELEGKLYVYVVDQDDVAHRREIVVQHEQDDSFVIASGVGADDRIVVDGIQQVHDGQPLNRAESRPEPLPRDREH